MARGRTETLLTEQSRGVLETAFLIISFWDRALAQHSMQVAGGLAQLIPHHAPPNPHEVELWTWAGQLHDIGKVGIPAHILSKPGAYTEQERKVMRRHPTKGAQLLQRMSAPELIVHAAGFHHEWWNGSGYPRGWCGKEIPYIARALAVVDAYDAMTHTRAYRSAYSPRQARLEIERLAGIQFDPQIVDQFFRARPRG